jgi:tRNA dimethylallyltransferase
MSLGEQPLLVIAGPTASGKSTLAVELAETLGRPAEIICADSITVYRGFEIGAAKPSAEDRARVPHHLVDICDPAQDFTAGDFSREAQALIKGMHARGAVPIVVGGTGFYLRALLWEMASEDAAAEARSAEVKRGLEERARREGFDHLYRDLVERDPQSVATVHENDHYRIVRALQAMELYGKPWSQLNREARESPPRYPGFRYFTLDVPKETLRERIRARTDAMLRAGLVAEVRGLLAQGVSPGAKPLRSVGYKETVEALASGDLAGLAEKIIVATRQLAKSQLTWFKGERAVEWIEPSVAAVRSALEP